MSPALLASIALAGVLACLVGLVAARAFFTWAGRRVGTDVAAALDDWARLSIEHYVTGLVDSPEDDATDDESFCGCCGRETHIATGPGWCIDCAGHVLKFGDLWDRTWFAQFNEPCPWQIGLDQRFKERADWDRWETDPGISPKRPRPYDQETGR